jgi:phosphoglycerate dehydrogenase-like enzyme
LRVLIGVSLEPEEEARLRAEFPAVEFVSAPGRERMAEAIGPCEVVYGGHITAEMVAAAPGLRWVQAFSAGVNHLPLEEMAARGITLTNASGAHGVPIAENILAMMLAFAIRLPDLVEARQRREWISGRIHQEKTELDGQTLLVIGLGGIGGALAQKAKGLGMRVLGFRRRALPPPPGVDAMVSSEELPDALAQADHVALCLPLTDETTAFLDEPELSRMKPTAYVYNVGRGRSLAREALLRALREGRIAGAGLDVTDPEPLPPDDPLWSLPNVILTQHTSGWSPHLDRRVTDIFAGNLRHYLAGEPLSNVVDPTLRY